jgi:hypothetical protein
VEFGCADRRGRDTTAGEPRARFNRCTAARAFER